VARPRPERAATSALDTPGTRLRRSPIPTPPGPATGRSKIAA